MALGQYLGAGSGVSKGIYHLDGNANDSSGNSANGTATNITWQGGTIGTGSALFVRTSASKIVTPFADPGSASTFIGKIKTTTSASSTNEYTFITKRNGTFTFQFTMKGGLSSNKIHLNDWGVTGTTIATSAINDGKWHTVAMVMSNSTTATVYTDGNQTGTSSSFSFVTQSFSNGNLLGDFNTGGRAFDGSMDEFIVENRAWTASEIRKYHTYSRGFFIL